jgi:hypothetical protein
MTLKHCNGCGEDKDLTEFNFHKSGQRIGKPISHCKVCKNNASSDWYKANSERSKARDRAWKKSNPERAKEYCRESSYRRGAKPATENKSCPAYLGCVIAETVLSHEFPGFKRMPYGNKGYDYDCTKGFKIDVKSGCRNCHENLTDRWIFTIRKNQIADYFLCIAFDNRKLLNPEHIWLIPGNLVNSTIGFSVSDLPKSLAKWSQYERPLENVLKCCNKLRGEA